MSYRGPLRSGRSRIVVMNLFHENCLGHEFAASGATGGSGAWPANNRLLAIPFTIQEPSTAVKGWYATGTSQANNVDMGILDEAGNRLVRNGGVALGAVSALHTVDFTDTLLAPGRYWLAIASDNTGATFQRFTTSANGLASVGVRQMATAYPIPDPVTFAEVASAYIPLVGLQFRVEDVV